MTKNVYVEIFRDAMVVANKRNIDVANELGVCEKVVALVRSRSSQAIFDSKFNAPVADFLKIDPLLLHLATASVIGRLAWTRDKIEDLCSICRGENEI